MTASTNGKAEQGYEHTLDLAAAKSEVERLEKVVLENQWRLRICLLVCTELTRLFGALEVTLHQTGYKLLGKDVTCSLFFSSTVQGAAILWITHNHRKPEDKIEFQVRDGGLPLRAVREIFGFMHIDPRDFHTVSMP